MPSRVRLFAWAAGPLLVAALPVRAAQQPPVSPHPAVSSAPATVPAVQAAAAGPAGGPRQCRTSRSFSSDVGFHVRMRVSSDGGSCSFDTDFVMTGRGPNSGKRMSMSSGELTAPPQHGAATLHFEGGVSSVDYTPAPGYAGPDQFAMHLLPSTRAWLVDVTVVK